MEPINIPKGAAIWVSPVGTGEPNQMPLFINGEPYSMNEDGVTKWQKIGGNDGD